MAIDHGLQDVSFTRMAKVGYMNVTRSANEVIRILPTFAETANILSGIISRTERG